MKGLARHPVPVMILARLAVDKEHQRQGLGQALLKDALLRTAQAADIAGIRCLLVHAKDDAARQWYESWEFEPSSTNPYHLFLMLKDLKNLLSGLAPK
jgi:GNAT superfamily N-acetyltransferase